MAEEKIPVSTVRSLSSEGKSEREIIHVLKSQGHSNEDISKALSIVMKDSLSQPQAPSQGLPAAPRPQPRPNTVSPDQAGYALPPRPPLPTMQSEPQSNVSYGQSNQQTIPMTMEEEIQLEELIEEILNEKWEEVRDSLIEWDRQISVTTEKMAQLEERMKDLENRHDSVREDIKDMLGTASDHIQIVEGRVGSIEKVFKEFLPSLTENVRSLSASVEKLDSRSRTTPKKK